MANSIPRTLGAKFACRIVNYDRDRLNEYVASGIYTAAPSTSAGRARRFTETDTVVLYQFARFIDRGADPRWAGAEVECLARGLLEQPNAEFLYVIEPMVGSRGCYFSDAPAVKDPANHNMSGHTIREVRGYNVGQFRRIVEHGFDVEFSTKDDDE